MLGKMLKPQEEYIDDFYKRIREDFTKQAELAKQNEIKLFFLKNDIGAVDNNETFHLDEHIRVPNEDLELLKLMYNKFGKLGLEFYQEFGED